MRALQLVEPKQFRWIDIAEPSSPGPDDVIVRVHRVGICGTDLGGYLGKMPFYSYPRIPGHELGVEVVAVGSEINHVKVGDRCSVEPYINNPASHASQRGRGNCCEELKVLGVHIDGGLRPLFQLPGRKLHPGNSLAYEQLALVETLAIGCHAVDRCSPKPGDDVLVIGAGPIGLSAMEFVRLSGARLIVMDINEQRLAFTKQFMGAGATIKFTGDGSELAALKEITGGNLAHMVIDATGNAGSMAKSLEYAAHTGQVVYVGITSDTVAFGHPLMHRKELTLKASRNALPADFPRIISLIEAGKIDTKPWITHRVPFDTIIERFPDFTLASTGAIKAIIDVSQQN